MLDPPVSHVHEFFLCTGGLSTSLVEEPNNNDDSLDCMAIIILADGKIKPVFVSCSQTYAR